jgi:hypothetical protein
MVSIDHFGQKLMVRLRKAAEQAGSIVISSDDICQSLRGGAGRLEACCAAMQAEVKPGDDVIVDQTSGAGMTVGYRLPRS